MPTLIDVPFILHETIQGEESAEEKSGKHAHGEGLILKGKDIMLHSFNGIFMKSALIIQPPPPPVDPKVQTSMNGMLMNQEINNQATRLLYNSSFLKIQQKLQNPSACNLNTNVKCAWALIPPTTKWPDLETVLS